MEKDALVEIVIKEDSWIARLAAKKLHTPNIAIVIGKTIHLYNSTKCELLQSEKWFKHEMCHVKQFKKYGFLPFIAMYLWESMKKGYSKNKYEIEAREAEKL